MSGFGTRVTGVYRSILIQREHRPRPLRIRARHGLEAILRHIPLPLLEVVRHRYASATDGTPQARVLKAALEVLRHRGIPNASFHLPDNSSVKFVQADSLILQRVYWMGERGWEPELLPWWRLLCETSKSIVEIGANVGYYTVQGALRSPGSRIVAVEPHPYSARILRENLRINGISNVEVVEAAAMDGTQVSHIELAIPVQDHCAAPAGALVAGRSEISSFYPEVVTVQVATIDVRSLATDIDLLKIDVEGMEFEILRALRPLIEKQKPVLIIELLDNTPNLHDFLQDLSLTCGYLFYIPTSRGLLEEDPRRIGNVLMRQEYGVRDIILSPTPLA